MYIIHIYIYIYIFFNTYTYIYIYIYIYISHTPCTLNRAPKIHAYLPRSKHGQAFRNTAQVVPLTCSDFMMKPTCQAIPCNSAILL